MVGPVYIRVCEDDGEIPVELPLEQDGTLLLATLTAQFPRCTGLKYKAPESGCFRGLRLADDHIYPPSGSGWSDTDFFCVFPKAESKRKAEGSEDDSTQKVKRLEGRKCTDLIVLNLSWNTDEDTLREYFSGFGEVVMVQLKRDLKTNKSRGYGFVRFSDYAAQVMCLAERHMIDNRLCDVRIPNSKVEGDRQEVGRKIHVGNLTEDVGSDVLRQFFSEYGRVIDVFIPRPFRSFAFVTFDDPDVASGLMGKDLVIHGCRVTIGSAVPKLPQNKQLQNAHMDPSIQALQSAIAPQFWDSWSSAFGMFPGAQSGTSPMGGGSRGSRNANSPMGLNPAAAAAAATLAAQYTRAHQRQNAGDYGASGRGGPESPNSAAMATLNILNNPNVVAAIVSAAAGAANNQPAYSSVGSR
ncbi:TAR DNA-binding protein 43 [Fasciola hepatica]|uniref:TAR DNA-binding protein 43 n=1 Tax=Fasciola hepatica TaxID=6192 RepID=A0A4E0RSY0_FASHE|nr:TAR DNA-binding protein 43 [Fasciola hepatica]